MCPLRGERARGLAPSAGADEARFWADPATVGGSIPLASSTNTTDDSTCLRLTALRLSLREGENHVEALRQAKLTLTSTKIKSSILGRHET